MPILNLHEFNFPDASAATLTPLTMMRTVTVLPIVLRWNPNNNDGLFLMSLRVFFFNSLRQLSQRLPRTTAGIGAPLAPARTLEKRELSDVDDTASGTDWLMLNSQQYLMHCLQHRKKRQKGQTLQCAGTL